MDYDDILKTVGEFGKYQKIKYLLVCSVAIFCAMQGFMSVFTLSTPKHRCSLPQAVYNSTDTWQNQSAAHSALVDLYIPVDSDGKIDKCHIYISSLTADGNRTKVKCDSWVYDTSERDKTVVTKLDLVCDKRLTATLLTSLFMFGNLAGSVFCGIISDMFGRRMALLIAIVIHIISGVVLSFAPEEISIGIARFFMGASAIQLFVSAFVMGIEIVGPKYRLFAGLFIEIFWSLGFCLLVGLAYAIRSVMYLQLAATLPAIALTSFYWFLPESARWLLVRGRISEAKVIIENIARTNGRPIPAEMEFQTEENVQPESIRELRHAPTLFCRTLIIFFNWAVVSMSYYGLSLNSGNMPGSLYVNMALSAAAEIIAYSLCFICFVAGRKWPHVVSMSLGGLACGASVLIYYFYEADETSRNWAFVGLNQMGKLGITMGFALIYIWSAEIYPTVLRNSLMGASSMMARFGSILAPYIADIGNFVPSQYAQMLPPLIFGVLTLAGGLLSIGLPETTGYDLPETIAQANKFPQASHNEAYSPDQEEEEKF